MTDLTTLRARAEALLATIARSPEPFCNLSVEQNRSWYVIRSGHGNVVARVAVDQSYIRDAVIAGLRDAPAIIRSLLAALPPEQPAPLTVGDALRWTHAAEYVEPSRSGDTGPACWCQAAGESWRFWRPDAVGGPRWSSWTRGVPAEDLTAACRLVPLAEADADPAGRGGL